MPTQRDQGRQDEWNGFVLRFLMHHGQESQRQARRLEMLESTVLRLCEDAPPTASIALHKAASDLRAEAQKRAADAEEMRKQVEELASMAYRFLSRYDAPPEATPKPLSRPKRPSEGARTARKKSVKKRSQEGVAPHL